MNDIVTVEGLAVRRRLPVAFLRDLGLTDVEGGGVSIPYRDRAGNRLFSRTRDVPGGPRFQQPRGQSLEAYGVWRLGDARRAGCLFLVEGESDCWTLWYHGLPALGLPGNTATTTLRAEYLDGVRDVWVVRENDDGGQAFALAVPRRLRELGYAGPVYVVGMPEQVDGTPVKDPSDLHRVGPGEFFARWEECMRAGRRWESCEKTPRDPKARNGRATVQEIVAHYLPAVEHCGHDDLLSMDLAPPSWLVRDLVADEGLTLLGGRKKTGKSWFCLQVAQAVAAGVSCLGREVVCGPVVYICLEDGRRRLRSRLLAQQTSRGLVIEYYTRFPPLDGEGMAQLIELLNERRPRLLILDTLAAAKTGRVDENAAGPMADLGNSLRALAQAFHCGVLATHHHGKLIRDDPGDDLRGSSAISAAGDLNMGLYKEQGGYLLRGEGRDVEEFELSLTFDPQSSWCWQLRQDGRTTRGTRAREATDAAVLDALGALGEGDAAAIAAWAECSASSAADHLKELAREGRIRVRSEQGKKGRPRLVYFPDLTTGDL